jgi:hypothetical protein
VRASSVVMALVLAAALLANAAAAQQPPTAIVTDEVIVRGRTPEALRFEIERAEELVFERFNAINSHDDFDIHCNYEIRTGTRIPQRVCAPVFLRKAQATAARDTLLSLQGSVFGGGSEQAQAAWASYRHAQLEDEMQRLVQEDEQLLAATRRLLELRGIDDVATEQTADSRRSRGRQR